MISVKDSYNTDQIRRGNLRGDGLGVFLGTSHAPRPSTRKFLGRNYADTEEPNFARCPCILGERQLFTIPPRPRFYGRGLTCAQTV